MHRRDAELIHLPGFASGKRLIGNTGRRSNWTRGVTRCRRMLSRASARRPTCAPPSFQAELGELNAFRALQQVPRKRLAFDDVLQEELPLNFERVVVHVLDPARASSRRKT